MNDQQYLDLAKVTDAETPETAPTTPEVASEANAAPVEMFELGDQKFPSTLEAKIAHGGEILKVPLSKMANTYRQFQHLQDKWTKEYKPKIEDYEKNLPEYQAAKQFKDKYGQLQEWSEKNPKEWETLWNLYQNKDKHLLESKIQPPIENAQLGNNPNFKPFVDEITALKNQLNDLVGFKQAFENKEKEAKLQADTEYVKGEVETFKKEYPEINLEERDPDGVTLWAKIMKFGIDKNLPDFESAAMKFLKPRLIDTWSSRARNETVKGIKTDNRQGIVKRSATPITGQGAAPTIDPKKMSYAEMTEYFKNNPDQFATA
jgi:hypothetical protein